MFSMLRFRGLRSFCLAARHLSFKRAADELCLTASAVSHQIRDLEEYLGVRLFERRTRAIVLTEDGSALYRDVYPHLLAIDRAGDRLRERGSRCPLVVRMPEFFASELFMPRVADFSSANPHIDLRIETTAPGASHSERADVSIVLAGRAPELCRSRLLFPIRYVPACNPEVHDAWRPWVMGPWNKRRCCCISPGPAPGTSGRMLPASSRRRRGR